MKKIIVFLTCTLCTLTVYAQHEHTLHFMPSIGQYTYTNPALRPNYKVTIGLPGISSNYVSIANSGFKYKDLIYWNKEEETLHLTLNDFTNHLGKRNYIQVNASVDLFHLTFKAHPRLFLSINATAKTYKRLMYPQDMFDFVVKGNGDLLGQTLNLSPKIESTSYLEVGLGGSYRVNQKLTLGTRFKILRGIENITTKQADLKLTTNEDDYSINIQAGASVLTSNITRLDNDEDIELSEITDYINNKGYAIDLGATYALNDRITLGLSLLDLGFINWSEDTQEYYMDPGKANYTLRGAEVSDLLEDGSGPFSAAADSVEVNFEFDDRPTGGYRSSLPVKTYLSGRYKLSHTVTTGAVFFMEKFRERWNGGFSANIAKEFGSKMAASLSYSMMNRSYTNFGGGLSINMAPLQLYFVSDNLLNAAYYGITKGELNDYIHNVKSLNLRFGLSFVFGREKGPVSQYSK